MTSLLMTLLPLLLAALVTANTPRQLQDTLSCLLTASDPTACCSSSTNDELCTLIKCINVTADTALILSDASCSCSSIVGFCQSSAMFLSAAAPGVGDLCNSVEGCCSAETTNEEFNSCLGDSGANFDGLTGGVMGGGSFNNETGDASYTDMFGGLLGDETTNTPSTVDGTTTTAVATVVESSGEEEAAFQTAEGDSDPSSATDVDASGAMSYTFSYAAFYTSAIVLVLV